MQRPTVSRVREIASLLVVGSLLASVLAPAVLVSAQPLAPQTAVLPSAEPTPDLILTADVPGELLGGAGNGGPGVGAAAAARKPADPSGTLQQQRPRSRCEPPAPTVHAARVVTHGPRDRKVVALTFDDGWDPANTLKILATLRHFHVNATFFPVGRAVQLFPAVWQAVADAGYPIGDHSYDHPHLKGLCFSSQLAQLTRPQSIIRDVLGIEPLNVMRPPYGAYDWATRLAANAAGDADVVLWDVDTRDWSGLSRFAIARGALAGGNGSIVLMHTFPHATTAALAHIIYGYWKRGYTFVTVGQLLGLGGPVPYP